MNRAERRRQQKAEQRRRPTVIVGPNIVARPEGIEAVDWSKMAELPRKEPGKHRWIATAGYVLSDAQARTAYDENAQKTLSQRNMFVLAIGCYDCEEPLAKETLWNSHCPAPESP